MRKIAPQTCRVIQNKKLDRSGAYHSLKVADFRPAKKIFPGYFVHVKVADAIDPLFRRAFSIAGYDTERGELEIIYKIVGKGTSLLARKAKGEAIDLIGPLGNCFAVPSRTRTIVIVAGGIGFPPLYFLADFLISRGYDGSRIQFFYGGRSKEDLIEMKRIRRLGVGFTSCTDDGSYGFRGFVTEAVRDYLSRVSPNNTVVYGCGPEPMLAALQNLTLKEGFSGEVSLEAPMPCGIGVCLGCVKPRRDNPRAYVRVCYDGPVFKMGEVDI